MMIAGMTRKEKMILEVIIKVEMRRKAYKINDMTSNEIKWEM